MHSLIAIAGMVFAVAATPGPNNLIVLHLAAHRGLAGARPAIAGIVLGGLTLLALVILSMSAVFIAAPWMKTTITVVGALYLIYLSGRLVVAQRVRYAVTAKSDDVGFPESFAGVFGFQFLNPKGWVMVLTAVAALPFHTDSFAAFSALAVLFAAIPLSCLVLWASVGTVIATRLGQERFRRRFDIAMGTLLAGSAILLLIGI